MKLETPRREPSLLQALTPLLFLMVLLALAVYLYADNASYGANQIALLLAGGVAALIGIRNGMSWRQIQESLVHGISLAVVPIFILLAVGALIGTWMLSGTVPTLIVYGLKLLHPSFFYPAACLICAIVALAIGSSWTVAGTLGVALIGVAQGLDMSLPITAGAVISGAYFGDKMSPLSDTTNIAPAAAGSELFAHIRHMTWTTVPSITIALLLFTAIGLGSGGRTDGDAALGDLPTTLAAQFNMGWHLLIPLIVVFALAVRRFPAYPTILIGALLGALFAVVFQPEAVLRLAGNDGLSRPMALLSGAWTAMFDGFKVETGNAAVDELLSRGGMSSMLNTVWLVVCAMGFGAVMESTGLLERMIRSVLKAATGSAKNITPKRENSRSKRAVPKSALPASACRKARFATAPWCCRATRRIGSEMSTARTAPSGDTACANTRLVWPPPQPTSSTCSPGFAPARASRRAVRATKLASLRSMLRTHVCPPSPFQ